MKASFRILAAGLAASLALVSCDKESLTKTDNGAAKDGLRTITLSFANNGTKTALGDNNTPYFVGGETIKVAKSDGSATPVDLTVTVTDNVATITTELDGELIAVYPSTAAKVEDNKITGVQVSTQQDGTFPSANICMATISDGKNPNAVFLNKTAVFKITPKAGADTKYVEVITAGPEIADAVGGSKPYDSKHKIHVETTSADPVYVSILVPSGLKIRDLSFADGTNMKVNKSIDAVGAGTLYTVSSDNWDYEYVELAGLKWATMNVGASSPTGYGDYFAWGETTGHSFTGTPDDGYLENAFVSGFANDNTKGFSWTNCPLSNHDEEDYRFSKYVPEGYKTDYGIDGYYDDKDTLDLEDDAANVQWGGSWRMPTQEEFDALADLTNEWVANYSNSGVSGRKFSENTNSIFLPAAGFGDGTDLYNAGVRGYYWSSSLDTDYPLNAFYLDFYDGGILADDYDCRYGGYSVRPLSE